MRELLLKLGCKLGDIAPSFELSSSASNCSHSRKRRLSLDSSASRRSLSTTLSGLGSSGLSSSSSNNNRESMIASISSARSSSFKERTSSSKALDPLLVRSENARTTKDSSSCCRSKSRNTSSPLLPNITRSQPLPHIVNSILSIPSYNVSESPCHVNVPINSTSNLDEIPKASLPKQVESPAKSKEVDPLCNCSNQSCSCSVHNTIVSQHTLYEFPIHTQQQQQQGRPCIIISSDEEDEDDKGHKPYYTNRSFIQKLKQATVKREDRKYIFGVA